MHIIRAGVCALALGLALDGCTAVELSKIQPPKFLEAYGLCVVQEPATARNFTFVATTRGTEPKHFTSFDAFFANIRERIPAELRNDNVTNQLATMFANVSGHAQLAGAGLAVSEQADEINRKATPSNISHEDLKTFTYRVLEYLHPKANPTVALLTAQEKQEWQDFIVYLTAYYEGKFVDRFGQPIKNPSLSLDLPLAVTVTDADIAATLTFLLEFVFDMIDPTPVLGDAKTREEIGDKTKFFPGGDAKNRPTALLIERRHYEFIPEGGPGICGVTQKNIAVLAGLAGTAGDRAALISGLIANSVGGIEVGLGVLGKISLGDNQTLTIVVKIFASRLARRLSYAALYGTMQGLTHRQVSEAAIVASN